MGVDLIESSQTGKKFALKRMTCHSIEDQNTALREVEVTRQLQHPNIVRLVGAGTQGEPDILHNRTSEVLIVFPFYKQSLQDELERRELVSEPLAQDLILGIFFHICSAVRELHTAQPPLAHRDIKPHNILLDRDLSPILMDFGSAAPARLTVSSLKEAAYLQGPFDSVYERGDSVALAVQGGNINFPETPTGLETPGETVMQELQDLIIAMTNLDINFRMHIDSVIEKIQLLRETSHGK